MAEQVVAPGTEAQWQWNGEQWLWWDDPTKAQAWDRLIQMYVQRGPDGILADDPGSFAVNRADVTKVKLTSTGNGTAGHPRLDYLIIKAAGTKYKMLLAGGKDYARSALRAAGLM